MHARSLERRSRTYSQLSRNSQPPTGALSGSLGCQTPLSNALYRANGRGWLGSQTAAEPPGLRGPAAILFISRDTCHDSIAKLFRACFYGVSHDYRAIRCKMGYRTDVPVKSQGVGYRTTLGECQPPLKSIARYGVSQR